MRQVSIVAAVLILISVPCDGDSSATLLTDNETSDPETPAMPPETGVLPPGTSDDSITSNLVNKHESAEDQQESTYKAYNLPSPVNFHEIYRNSLALLADDPFSSIVKTEATEPYKEAEPPKDDEPFHLSNIHTRFVEFPPKTQTIPPRIYGPKVINEKELDNKTTTTTITTAEEPEDLIEVIPIKKENYQRGLLDLLFPAARVRTFKSVFDTFKRIMSHTFR